MSQSTKEWTNLSTHSGVRFLMSTSRKTIISADLLLASLSPAFIARPFAGKSELVAELQ